MNPEHDSSTQELEANADDQFYIVNLSHHDKKKDYLTFWRPEDKGYCYPLSWSGKYSRAQIDTQLDYYHNGGSNIAVSCAVIDSMTEPPTKGSIDGDAGPIVRNSRYNWNVIMGALIEQPWYLPCQIRPASLAGPGHNQTRTQAPADVNTSEFTRERGG